MKIEEENNNAIRSLEFNSLALAIFNKLIEEKNENHKKTKSFIKDILLAIIYYPIIFIQKKN